MLIVLHELASTYAWSMTVSVATVQSAARADAGVSMTPTSARLIAKSVVRAGTMKNEEKGFMV